MLMVALIQEAAPALAQTVKLENSAGEVWKYVAYVLSGVVIVLVGIIWKDVQEDKKDAKEREARLNDLLSKRNGG